MSPIRRARPLMTLACALLVTAAATESASAGTYIVRNCNVPGEARRTVGPWHMNQNQSAVGTFWNDDCASGGGFGVNVGTIAWGISTGVTLETPPTIAIRRVRLWLVARLRSTGSALYSVLNNGNATSSATVDLFGPPGGSTLTTPYESASLPADTRLYHVLVNCTAGTGEPCTAVDTSVLDIRGVETTLEEVSLPTGSIDGGELLAGNPQAGLRTVAYTVGDQQSGVARISVLIGKTVAGTADFAADCTFADFAACPTSRTGSVPVDTRKVPDGIYPVSLRVTDAAGNEQTVQSATAIQVLNGATSGVGATSGQGAVAGARITASFAKNRRSALTVGYGRRARVRGRLAGPGNEPVGGALIDVAEASATGRSRTVSLTTAPDGSFTHTIPRGTSRTVTFTYRGVSTVVKRLRLRVLASATLSVRLSGITVRYGGRVLSKPLISRGKLVEIQGRAPGAGWKTFARRRANNRGEYSGTYRLRVHRPGVRLQFRVRIPTERGYPFVAHAGRAVSRTVR